MRFKKITSVILAASMLLSTVGCGAAQEQTQESEQETEVVSLSLEASEVTSETALKSDIIMLDDNYRNYYEIFVYSFYDSDGDGIGDLNGVTAKLDYIEEMGFNGIWLMPVFASATYHKYDVTDYMTIDAEYGMNEDMQNLIDACHSRGINIIIDMPINHTSSSHAWFTQACEYLHGLDVGAEADTAACPYVDYYHFSHEKVNTSYYQVANTDWYYEGSFWSEMPDLNLANESLRAELEEIAAYWIDMGVDGFRMDAALHYEEDDTAFNTETMNWFYTYCKSLNDDFYMVSEVWDDVDVIAEYYASETPSLFNFDAADGGGKLLGAAAGTYKASALVKRMLKYQTDFSAVYADYIDAAFLTNHDMARVAYLLDNDEDDMKYAAGLLMMMSGSTFVYYGEEIGMTSAGSKDENKRLAMIWSDSDTTGMTNGPVDADDGIVSAFAGVEEQMVDEDSLLNYYKKALHLRNVNPEIARGEIALVEELCAGRQAAITKTWGDSTIGIVYHSSEEAAEVSLAGTALEGMDIAGYLTLHGEEITLEGDVLQMQGKSICILR